MTRSPQSTPLEAPTSPTRRGFLNGMTALGVAQVTAGTAGLVSLVACGGGGSEVVAPAVNRAPVANNFSLPMNIGSQPRSVNWKNLSFVSDPDGNTLVATVSHNGTSGNFSVVGDMLTYTPNSNTTALTDSGRLGIADGKGGSTEISVGVNGVDTMGASLVSEVFANISGGPAIPGTNFGSTFDTTLMLNEPVTSVQ